VLHHENRDKGVRIIAVCPPPVATPLLEQATSKPKVLEVGKPIPPGQVLDAIERDLAKGKPFCFPNGQTKLAQVMRRLFPGLVWWGVHRIEGQ
jgi:short-subunit dehydrogenase